MGLAVGDCMGVPLEFSKRGTLPKVTEMIGGGPFHLNVGEWTDDTSMALCLAHSLIECKGFDPTDQMEKYVVWNRKGYMSSNGRCFDIGNTCAEALGAYVRSGDPYSGLTNERSQGNGSLMRLAPIPMAYRNNHESLKWAVRSSKVTHAHPTCYNSCAYLTYLIANTLNGESKETILLNQSLYVGVESVSMGAYKTKTEAEIKSSGYVIDTLEAALWAFYTTDSFEEGCIKVVNLGDDSDTVGAVYGQLAGAYYGYDAIPKRWVDKIVQREMILEIADKLLEFNSGKNG